MRSIRLLSIIIVLLCIVTLTVSAEDAQKARGDYLTVKLLTLGQGDPLYIWYGHVGLIVEDEKTDRDLMFDFGVFDFTGDHFYRNFAFGRLYYQVIASYEKQRVDYAMRSGRDASMITLDLPAENKERIYRALVDHIQPENSTYLYHHYYNNCATKIRDIIDDGLDGQLKDWAEAIPSEYSYREHIRRYSGNHLLEDFVLNYLQSGIIDGEISLWDEMFLPDRMERAFLAFSYTDDEGNTHPLVSEHEILADVEERPEIPEEWSPKWPAGLLLSLITAGVILLLHTLFLRNGNRLWSILLGIIYSLYGLLTGVLSSILTFMMFFSDHDVTYGNWNLLLLNPLMLLIGVFGIMMIFSRRPELLLMRCDRIWIIMAAGSTALLFLKIFTIIGQQNQLSIAMIVPLNLCLGLFPLFLKKRASKENS